mgnify:CR=1 FL=1|tara:strand:- start:8459 stop:10276 length:1818 start_codon:yes stop_codon:yes gene_type:complete
MNFKNKYFLGISCFYHNSSAALVEDNKIIAAAEEERFSRIKHDKSFPIKSILFCLEYANISIDQINSIVFYDNSFKTLERFQITNSRLKIIDYYKASKKIINNRFFIRENFKKFFNIHPKTKIYFLDHHLSHASSAFYPSAFSDSAILTIDAVGEWATTTIAHGSNNKIKILKSINFPNSVGLLYSAFTSYCGFKVNSGEYKLMGLAPYGKPNYYDILKNKILKIFEDGSIKLNLKYFNFRFEQKIFTDHLTKELGFPPRLEDQNISQEYCDLASSIQKIVEEIVINLAYHAKKITNSSNLVMAGGVALNCVANGKLYFKKIFKNIWIQPASGDAGGALGAALYISFNKFNNLRIPNIESQKSSLLGPYYNNQKSINDLEKFNCVYKIINEKEIPKYLANKLIEGNIIGFFNGRMEYGPRALGSRSILADPRIKKAQTIINKKIKYRESFRPFAAMLLREDANKFYDFDEDTSYMLFVSKLKKSYRINQIKSPLNLIDNLHLERSEFPAVIHADYSTRLQILKKNDNKILFEALKIFKKETGIGIFVNTSFNIRGEPIVCTPTDAYKCFMRTELDILIINNLIFKKRDQPKLKNDIDWKKITKMD